MRILQQGDAQIPLIEALITLGIAQVRSGSVLPGRATFERAIQLAETNGAHELLILAVTAALEELSEHLEMLDKVALYARAQGVVTNVHRGEIIARLCSCAFLIVQDVMPLDNLTTQSVSNNGSNHTTDGLLPGEQVDWPHVSIRELKRQLERAWIMRALIEASGEPTKAADLLGLRHGDLDSMIERRHKDLITARKPKRTRHRSIIKR